MERLIKRSINTSHENNICCTHFKSKDCFDVGGNCAYDCKWEEKAWSKLAEYEDLEEQGLLIRLPCKPSDVTVYQLRNKKHALGVGISPRRIYCTSVWANGDYALHHQGTDDCLKRDFNKTWFLTKEEAERALEEIEK